MKRRDPSENDDGPDTLVREQARTGPTEAIEDPTSTLDGYTFGEVIGRGGIGEVVLAHDLRIGRDVAVKRLRAVEPTDDEAGRFLREARIQARLDHPAIPPVYELGRGPDGRPFFTMKRLAGQTLAALLGAPEPNRPRLLRAFAEVCLAIEFAHSRGVVHRDLKPSNIMIGEFGEVYVLDWGLARVVGEAAEALVSEDIDSLDIKTGDLLGTPGYMAPEQLQRAGEAGRPADVYALGSILFELLAGEPLHPRGPEALPSTVGGEAITSPARRRPDRAVPPELDAVCAAMLQIDASLRPTARRVAERVEAYLDGDRDVARRRAMAVDLVWAARASYHEGLRGEAMRAAGRALALDPEAAEAAELVTTLMLEPPDEPPPELRAALAQSDGAATRKHARTAIAAYLAISSFLPFAMWDGVRKWGDVLGVFFGALLMAVAAWRIMRKPQRNLAEMMVYALGNVVLMGLLTRMLGPFTFVPAITCIVVMSMLAYPVWTARPVLLIAVLVLGYLAPIGLELRGVLDHTWKVVGENLVNMPGALKVSGTPTIILLVVASTATIAIAGAHAARIYRASRSAQRQLALQAWHLRQLLPAGPLDEASLA